MSQQARENTSQVDAKMNEDPCLTQGGNASVIDVTRYDESLEAPLEPDKISDSSQDDSRCLKMLKNISIEPMLFLKMLAEGNFYVVGDTLEIDRICKVNLGYSENDCENMDDGNHTDLQNEVQIYQNTFNYHQTLMDSIIPVLLILFFGSLSDKYGRKPAMISVLIGFILFGCVYILMSFQTEWPVQVLYLATLCADLGGTWVVFNMAVYSYIADITTVASRTKRMGIADAVWYMGFPLGTMLGGWLFRGFGYTAVFGTSTILWTGCLFYTIFCIKDSPRFATSPQEVFGENTVCGRFKQTIMFYGSFFKKRPGNARHHIVTLMVLKLGVFLVQGHQVYSWSRKVLGWDATQFSTWSSIDGISHEIGMVSFVWVAEKYLWHNCTVAAGGLVSIMLWSAILACITGPSMWWLTIIASFAGMLEPSIEPAIRSMLTAVGNLGEEGRVLAFLGMLESLWLSVDRALYTFLYNTFIDVFPQINFVVQASIALILIAVVLALKRSLILSSEQSSTSSDHHSHDH